MAIIASVALTTSLTAQKPASEPATFEVASIRRSPDPTTRVVAPSIDSLQTGGLWRARDITIGAWIRWLYPALTRTQVVGGAEWMWQELYDIEARASATAHGRDVRAMVAALLTDRLKLDAHNETRQLPAVLLTLPKGRRLGSGFSKPAVDCAKFRAEGGERPNDPTRQQFADRLGCALVIMPTSERTLTVAGANLRLTGGDVTLKEVAPWLSREFGRPVLDQTGVTERYDIELQFSSQPLNTTTVDSGPGLRTAISEQLGLVTEDSRAPLDVLVIDRIE